MYNIAEDVDRYTCFNDDPRLYEDIDCKTPVANDTFDCLKGCWGDPVIEEGQTYTLNSDRRCTYKIYFWDKTETKRNLLFEYLGYEEVQYLEDGSVD